MWICPNCHTENRDMANACQNCGVLKSAGRFGSAPVQRESANAPRVRAASAPSSEQHSGYRPNPVREQQRPHDGNLEPKRPPLSPLSVFGRIIGWALMILLPVIVAMFAWRQYDAVSQAVLPLLLAADAAEVASIACYAGLALAAGLLSMLPGLWTLLLCRRPQTPWRPRR